MITRLLSFNFLPSTKEITFRDVQIVEISRIQYIINITTGQTMYDFSNPTPITTDGYNVVTVSTSTAGMKYTDELAITYDFDMVGAGGGVITLTTTGTSGAATLIANVLNIPQYAGGGGGITRIITSVAINTTIAAATLTDYVYFTSGTITLTLPTAIGNTNRYTIVHTDTSTLTIAAPGGQTIAFYPATPAITATITAQGTVVELYSNNANWWTI